MLHFNGNWIFQNEIGNTFLQECENIVNNESMFDSFKQNQIFRCVIGNDVLSMQISDILYNNIKGDSDLLQHLDKFKTNDIYGSPNLYSYELTGKISPGTLYFMNIVQSLRNNFGDISKFNIVEIGSGYGGQAKIILDYGVKNYNCIDVKETLSLCKKYIDLFNYKNINFYKTTEIPVNTYDLVISNWCLSEFDIEGIRFYIETVIKHCNYGYFLMNIWDDRKDFLVNEIRKYFSSVEILPEYSKPHSTPNWVLIVKK
jgi:putative sugar O-methyltransferase